MLTTQQIATRLGVQHELVRDAAGQLFSRTKGLFPAHAVSRITSLIELWRSHRS